MGLRSYVKKINLQYEITTGLYMLEPWEKYVFNTLRVRGSVIPSVVTDVIVVTTFATIVLYIDKSHIIRYPLNVPNIIVPALSVVVGLILAFRTNTAYDRFWEGRKLWANLDVQIRNFSRMIWVGMKDSIVHTEAMDFPPPKPIGVRYAHQLFGRSDNSLKGKSGPNGSTDSTSSSGRSYENPSRVENVSHATLIDIDDPNQENEHGKILVIRLLLAFAVSVKHHLRQEFGTRYYDLEHLLPEGYVPCASTEDENTTYHNYSALGDRRRQYNEDPWNIHAGNDDGQMSLPLEIAHGLSLWVIAENRAGRIESCLVGNLLTSINSMTDIFTNMERIVFTPIPLAYSIHLRQVVYCYCLALPFTFLDALGWLTIPLMCLVSFTLFGMEAIGREIENPFGKDENDLHMDEFCRDLKRELDYTVTLRNSIPGAHV
ncbi:hypothetical protein BGZ76_008505 [Entomortierella beljakovae]|nr:hypothetical protein BGZ76_008505 [Entomortierella beljakovae]